jgi:hypothetical protein
MQKEFFLIFGAFKEILVWWWFTPYLIRDLLKSTVDAIHALRGGTLEFSSIICNIQSMLLCNPNFMWSLLSDRRIWLPTRLLERSLFGLVAVLLRHYQYIFPFYRIMKWYKFVLVKKKDLIVQWWFTLDLIGKTMIQFLAIVIGREWNNLIQKRTYLLD